MLELAKHIIDNKTGKFEPEQFEDRYENALIELIRSEEGQCRAPQPDAADGTNVINLMDALKQSIAAAEKKPKAASASRAKPGKKRA